MNVLVRLGQKTTILNSLMKGEGILGQNDHSC